MQPRFTIDAVPLTSVVRPDEARAPDLGHYLVGDPADIILVVEANWVVSSGAYSLTKTLPELLHLLAEPANA